MPSPRQFQPLSIAVEKVELVSVPLEASIRLQYSDDSEGVLGGAEATHCQHEGKRLDNSL